MQKNYLAKEIIDIDDNFAIEVCLNLGAALLKLYLEPRKKIPDEEYGKYLWEIVNEIGNFEDMIENINQYTEKSKLDLLKSKFGKPRRKAVFSYKYFIEKDWNNKAFLGCLATDYRPHAPQFSIEDFNDLCKDLNGVRNWRIVTKMDFDS